MKTIIFTLVMALTIAVSAFSYAKPNHDKHKNNRFFMQALKSIDEDHNQVISAAEWGKAISSSHTFMDVNRDRVVTHTELVLFRAAKKEQKSERMLKQLDANADGLLSLEEFAQGKVLREEHRKKNRAETHPRSKPDSHSFSAIVHRIAGLLSDHKRIKESTVRAQVFAVLDSNGNNELEPSEINRNHLRTAHHFVKLDLDQNGEITKPRVVGTSDECLRCNR